ncbi:MAG: LCP family protein [Oscillospiraceae bacterium]|jgi:LCP family protein required for cell wall assembly
MKLYGSTSKKKRSSGKAGYSSATTTRLVATKSRRSKTDYNEDSNKSNRINGINPAKKKRRRIITLCVVLAIVFGLLIAYKLVIKPPDIDQAGPEKKPNSAPQDNAENNEPEDPMETEAPAGDRINNGVYTFLVVGNDNGYGNTDTILVGRLDTVEGTLNVINIPRDTLVNVSWGTKKVNTLLSGTGSIEGLISGIKNLIGFTIDCWAVVDLEAFVKLVDTIGGVYYDVPVNMYWDAPDQDLHIAIPKGYQHLDGEEALKVVRFRQGNDGSGYPDGDIGRIRTQQDFLKTVASQLLKIGNATKVDEFAKIFKEYVDTNMTLGNIVWFGLEFLKLSEEDINFYLMPGNYNGSVYGISYVYVYLDEWLEMINTKLNPFKTEITESNVNILTKDSSGNLYSTTGQIAGANNWTKAPGYNASTPTPGTGSNSGSGGSGSNPPDSSAPAETGSDDTGSEDGGGSPGGDSGSGGSGNSDVTNPGGADSGGSGSAGGGETGSAGGASSEMGVDGT